MSDERGTSREKKEEDALRQSFREDFTMFLLDNILMTAQFFKNYERDMEYLEKRSRETTPLDYGQFKCFTADNLHKLVGSKVTFRRDEAKGKNGKEAVSEFHNPIRTFVTYGNVETRYNATLFKRESDDVDYKLIVQPCEDDTKDASGYVNLIEHEAPKDDGGGGGGGSDYIPHVYNQVKAPDGGCEREVIKSDVVLQKNDNFFYIDPERRSKPISLNEYRTRERIHLASSIPRSCFKEREKRSASSEKRRTGLFKEREQNRKVNQRMLLSAAFKRHFCEVFVAKLCKSMNLDGVDPDVDSFHWDHVSVTRSHDSHFVTPVLEFADWPHRATDFSSAATGRKRVEWPTEEMKAVIKGLGCSLVPVGYHEADSSESDYTMEWRMDFPRAESYLMTRMMHTHVRCYLFAFILYKTFIEIEGYSHHFGPSHLANHLFLLVRENFLAWPEYSQGESLLKFLRLLLKTLENRDVKHFFINKRNLFANAPLKALHKAQYFLTRIIQNPIPYVLKALGRLKHKDDFYPEFDYVELYRVLVADDLQRQSPVAGKKKKGKKSTKEAKPPTPTPMPIDETKILKWDHQLTSFRRVEILRMFIEHFIQVGNASLGFETYDHAMLYLVHARRLVALFSEESLVQGDALDFRKRVAKAMSKCAKRSNDRNPEATPKREVRSGKRLPPTQKEEAAEHTCTKL